MRAQGRIRAAIRTPEASSAGCRQSAPRLLGISSCAASRTTRTAAAGTPRSARPAANAALSMSTASAPISAWSRAFSAAVSATCATVTSAPRAQARPARRAAAASVSDSGVATERPFASRSGSAAMRVRGGRFRSSAPANPLHTAAAIGTSGIASTVLRAASTPIPVRIHASVGARGSLSSSGRQRTTRHPGKRTLAASRSSA